MKFSLPQHINAHGLIPFLGQLSTLRNEPEIELNFEGLHRVSPAGLAALTAWSKHRTTKGFQTHASGLERCPIKSYLQRMNLLRLCDWASTCEDFQRRDENNRFIPLEVISHQVEDLGDRFASCIAPGGEDYEHPHAGLYDASWYLITELANNVRQHSLGEGIIVAQTTQKDGFVRIAIADDGKGIPQVLENSGITTGENLTDMESINRALLPRISSKGQPSNEGVGLTLSARVTQLLGGSLLVNSQKGLVICSNDGKRTGVTSIGGDGFPGTLITLAIPKGTAAAFYERLIEAKELEGLLRPKGNSANFKA